MIGFLLKKYFFDSWDSFFFIIILNFGFLLFLALGFALLFLAPKAGIMFFLVFAYCLFVYLCSAASVIKDISDYRRPSPMDFLVNLKNAFLPAGVLFTVLALVFFVLCFTVPVYVKMGNITGLAAAFFSCWICLFILGAVQFYPAVYYRLGMHPLKSLKKCAIIFFDNTGFCFFTLFANTIFSVLILPFPGCPLLFLDEALRLRLFKYDWLDTRTAEQHNGHYEKNRRKTKIPWNELLAEEREKTGNRSWKSFFFPWKE